MEKWKEDIIREQYRKPYITVRHGFILDNYTEAEPVISQILDKKSIHAPISNMNAQRLLNYSLTAMVKKFCSKKE